MSEKVLLVGVDWGRKEDWPMEQTLNELKDLVKACQGEPVDSIVCRVARPTPNFLIGSGKLKEIIDLCQSQKVDTVIFSHDLKGSQQRNLEEALQRKTVDRTQLILDIFARRAKSREGKMQVELAQLQYLLPRLVGKGIELSRPGGGIGTLGPGETKLETDRRRISARITRLKQDLKDLSLERQIKRKKRKENALPTVALVGYTSAGKSTLLNRLTQSDQPTRAGLFTTLDPIARQCLLPNQQRAIISDTVGFMHELPHHLIEAFHATLEEVQEADLLLLVLDVSHPNFRSRHEAVGDVLRELDCRDKLRITVLNKIDCLPDKEGLLALEANFDPAVAISGLTGENVTGLLEKMTGLLFRGLLRVELKIPLERMDLMNLIHRQGQVHSLKYFSRWVRVVASVSPEIAGRLRAYAIGPSEIQR